MDPGFSTNLLDLLSNHLVFSQLAPYLPASALLKLSATSKSFQNVVYTHPNAFRRLDLSVVRGADVDFLSIDRGGEIWRNERMDEAVTEEDFYGGPLRGIFSWLKNRNFLSTVHILILDGQSAPAEVLREIICEDRFQVRILSLINALNLNTVKFQQVIRYAIRTGRPKGTPRVKGIYYFGLKPPPKGASYLPSPPDSPLGITVAMGAQIGAKASIVESKLTSAGDEIDPWYHASGELISNSPQNMADWGLLLEACRGLIAWDAVVCRGPRHDTESLPALASIALGPKGCEKCHTSPEGPGSSVFERPLLGPPPLHSSALENAQHLPCDQENVQGRYFYARCKPCMVERRCEECGKWWCEDCYHPNATNGYISDHAGRNRVIGIKVHYGLCTENCLVGAMYRGAGSGGMWG